MYGVHVTQCISFFFFSCRSRWVTLSSWDLHWRLVPDLVDLSKRSSGTTHRHPSSAAFVKQSSRGPFSAGAQKPAWRFLPLQWSPRWLVPPQLCPALTVPMGCAWFSRVAGTFRWSWARRYPLGYVLVVCGRTSLVRAAACSRRSSVVLIVGLLHQIALTADHP